MDPNLFFSVPPPLDPAWLAHEQNSGLLLPQAAPKSPQHRQELYSQACKDRNEAMLRSRDSYLATGIIITDSTIPSTDGYPIETRTYILPSSPPISNTESLQDHKHEKGEDLIIYYHGGGLCVGDLDSEDLSCRRLCIETGSTVISINYRLLPEFHPNLAVQDAFVGFVGSIRSTNFRSLVIVGSSSGGQLAAQITQRVRDRWNGKERIKDAKGESVVIDGLLLRCPVTCDPTKNGKYIPERFKALHKSWSHPFETSLAKVDASWMSQKADEMPLETESFEGLPKMWVQLCTNDVYFSDGACFVMAVREEGGEAMVEVLEGWPHTFWLKAPGLERALEAENGMVRGVKWLQGKREDP